MIESISVVLWLSLKIAGLATVLNVILGIAIGFALARVKFIGKNFIDTLLTLPMVMPPTVMGYYLLVLLGSQSSFGMWLRNRFSINLIFTWQGAVSLQWW